MKLELRQQPDLYARLEQRIRHEQARNVVFLMHHGWVLCRDSMRRFCWLVFHPILEWLKYKVSRAAIARLRPYVISTNQPGRFLCYQLRQEL